MQKITFEDYPSTNTPIDASNLNQLQDNVENSINDLARDTETLVENITTYSTTEKVVGKWIDGSNLYAKTFNGSVGATTGSWVDIVKCNIEPKQIVDIKGIMFKTTGDKRVLSLDANEGSSYHITFSYLTQTDYLQYNSVGYQGYGFQFYVTLYYTKEE